MVQKISVTSAAYPRVLFVGIAIPFLVSSTFLGNSSVCLIIATVLTSFSIVYVMIRIIAAINNGFFHDFQSKNGAFS